MNEIKKLNVNGTEYSLNTDVVEGRLISGSFYKEERVVADYVEIGGLKWATMNVGATSVTDTGLYFAWGDTSGYTASQVSGSATNFSKYNSSDGKTVLDASDDAATANWGGNWRMPTTEEIQALGNAVNTAWTANYQGSGVAGLVLTDKTDSSKVLFFPAAGYHFNDGVSLVRSVGFYWSSSLRSSNVQHAYGLNFYNGGVGWQFYDNRYNGFAVRGVWDGEGTPAIVSTTLITPEQNKLYIDTTTNKIYRYNGSSYVEVSSAPTSLPASDVYSWAKAASKPSYTLDEVSDGSARKLSDYPKKTIEITWANLKSARDNSTLIPGQWYRITDYVTTTAQLDTQSAGHRFDVIVRADAVNMFNENAYAALHSGDTYFASSKINSWELKYCIDNDTNRFIWAETTNGKGVIYYMRDEYDNECPYDFKNIMFARYKITAMAKTNVLINTYSGLSDIRTGNLAKYPNNATISNTAVYRYTFDYLRNSTSNDLTIYQQPQTKIVCYCNTITSCFVIYNKKRLLNNIVMGGDLFTLCCCNKFYNNCQNNTFGVNLHNNTFGTNLLLNVTGNDFSNNIIGNNFSDNIIGNRFSDNIIGNGFHGNTTNLDFYCNTIGNNFSDNIIGNRFSNNIIGNDVYNNTIGNVCRSNTIGNRFYGNTFADQIQGTDLSGGGAGITLSLSCEFSYDYGSWYEDDEDDEIFVSGVSDCCVEMQFSEKREVSGHIKVFAHHAEGIETLIDTDFTTDEYGQYKANGLHALWNGCNGNECFVVYEVTWMDGTTKLCWREMDIW